MSLPSQLPSAVSSKGTLVLVGSSVRAAAQDAAQAGWKIVAIDRYGDTDLTCFCSNWLDYNDPSWVDQLEKQNPDCLIGVGGFERTPHLERICRRRNLPIFSASEPAVRSVNDPANLARLANEAGVSFPDTWQWDHLNLSYKRLTESSIRSLDGADLFLLKPTRHAGGIGIRRTSAFPSTPTQDWVQRYCTGLSIGASYLACMRQCDQANHCKVQTHLLGICQSMVASDHPTEPFIYHGSVGHLELPDSVRHQIARVGQLAATRFGLIGLFNIDFILNDTQLILLELNPRYSASMELLTRRSAIHHQTGSPVDWPVSLIDWHVRSFQHDASVYEEVATALASIEATRSTSVQCKRIVYAQREMIFDESIARDVLCQVQSRQVADHPRIAFDLADIPFNRSNKQLAIEAGQPVCTVLIRGVANAHSAISVADYAERQLQASLKTA